MKRITVFVEAMASKHDVCFDFSKKIKGPFVICKRKGMADLVNFLEHRLPGI